MNRSGTFTMISPARIDRNTNNPRRIYNDERMDLLRTSIQENGIQVPLTVYSDPFHPDRFVLMDGERRWRCALELGLVSVPVDVIDAPEPLDNLLHISNIQAVGDDWPLISIALWLRKIMNISGATGEARVVEMSGLPRNMVRRARRLLSLPQYELDLIQSEAHLDRSAQVHREDLYLEIEAAESTMRTEFPEIGERFSRDDVIRRLAQKREVGSLRSVTDLREVARLTKAVRERVVDRKDVLDGLVRMIEDPYLSPPEVFRMVAAPRYEEQAITRRAEALAASLSALSPGQAGLSDSLRRSLDGLREQLARVLKG